MDFFGVICSEVAPVWLARHFPAAEAEVIKTTIRFAEKSTLNALTVQRR